MIALFSKQRVYAFIMILGSGFLLFRTIHLMFFDDVFQFYVWGASVLLVAEFLVDLAWLIASIFWLISSQKEKAGMSLKLAAIAIIVHAIRVLIFVIGRTGPRVNLDVRPEYRADYAVEWIWLYLAGTLSALSVIGLVVVCWLTRHLK